MNILVENKHDTKTIIQNSLLELLDKSPIENITVRQISEKAFISRIHFYNYYLDKYNVLETMIKEFFTVFEEILAENSDYMKQYHVLTNDELYCLLYENTLKNIRYFESRQMLLKRLFGPHGVPAFIQELNNIYLKHFHSCLPTNVYAGNRKDETQRAVLYITKGIFAILENWIGNCFQNPPEDIAKSMTDLLMVSLQVLDL